jgi:hypothetical protein
MEPRPRSEPWAFATRRACRSSTTHSSSTNQNLRGVRVPWPGRPEEPDKTKRRHALSLLYPGTTHTSGALRGGGISACAPRSGGRNAAVQCASISRHRKAFHQPTPGRARRQSSAPALARFHEPARESRRPRTTGEGGRRLPCLPRRLHAATGGTEKPRRGVRCCLARPSRGTA